MSYAVRIYTPAECEEASKRLRDVPIEAASHSRPQKVKQGSVSWYALHCHSNYEARVQSLLELNGIEPFWPSTERIVFKGKPRQRTIRLSLLPGYVFARFDPENRIGVISLPGVVRIVGFGDHEPAPIAESEIESLRILLASGLSVEKTEYQPKPGDRISIRCGPLTGCEGYVTSVRGKCRVRVQIEMLGLAVGAEVDSAWLVPMSKAA